MSKRKQELLKQGVINVLGSQGVVSLKGDPEMKRTIDKRPKHNSVYDDHNKTLAKNICHLLLKTGVFEIHIHYDNSLFESESFFALGRPEVHLARDMLNKKYLRRQYPKISYKKKEKGLKKVHKFIEQSSFTKKSVKDKAWRDIMKDQKNFSLPDPKLVSKIVNNLVETRDIDRVYVRYFSINILNQTVGIFYNCGGSAHMSLTEFNDIFFWQQKTTWFPRLFFYFVIILKFFFPFLIKNILSFINSLLTSRLKSSIFCSFINIAHDLTAFLAFEFDFSSHDLTIVSNKFSQS